MGRAPTALLVTALLAGGCAPRLAGPGLPRGEELTAAGARIRLVYWPEDAASAHRVRAALERGVPRVSRWGGLRQPITITIHPTHAALERAVHRLGYGWLRAWARYDSIDLQSPRTWSSLGASDRKLEEVITHELTHCAMYQLAGDEGTWMSQGIPRWFSEGIASVTAGQGYRYHELDELHALYEEGEPGSGDGERSGAPSPLAAGDPILDPEPLYQERSHLVYGAAYHATELLLARHGEGKVLEILRLVRAGRRFGAAFEEAIGVSEEEFAAEFRRHVASRTGGSAPGLGGGLPRQRPGAKRPRRVTKRQPRCTSVATSQSRSP